MIDEPPVDIAGYIEDVLPFDSSPDDVMQALIKRGFKHEGWTPPTWRRQVRGGKSGFIIVKATHNSYVLNYWPVPSELDPLVGLVRRTGNARAILRETDRMIASFEPDGWQQF